MLENIRLSFQGIRSHRMRSALTMLGVIIGISSIIIIVAIIDGATQKLKDELVGNTSNTLTISLFSKEDSFNPYDANYRGPVPGISTLPKSAIKSVKALPGVRDATPIYNASTSVCNNATEIAGNTFGVEKDFFDINGLKLLSGRLLIEEDYSKNHNVAVLSSESAGALFSNEDPIGKTIVIKDDIFVVVGVVEKSIDYSKINTLSDYYLKIGLEKEEVYVPSTSWELVGGYDGIQNLIIRVNDLDEIVNISKKAGEILNMSIMNLDYEYKSGTLSEDSNSLEQLTQIAYLLLVGIASISLLVGGIGVMNIMLVSVTERTKEIGLKKALGAKRRIILAQFLTEAIVLTGTGGVIGILIGIGIAKLVGLITGLTIVISIPVIIIAAGFSMGVGIVFGLLPSIKASKLDPIEALRYE